MLSYSVFYPIVCSAERERGKRGISGSGLPTWYLAIVGGRSRKSLNKYKSIVPGAQVGNIEFQGSNGYNGIPNDRDLRDWQHGIMYITYLGSSQGSANPPPEAIYFPSRPPGHQDPLCTIASTRSRESNHRDSELHACTNGRSTHHHNKLNCFYLYSLTRHPLPSSAALTCMYYPGYDQLTFDSHLAS